MRRILAAVCGFVSSISLINATVIYQESVQGDFSDDYLNPNFLVLGAGDNVISGSLLGGSADMDLFTLTVPAGFEVTALRVTAFVGGINGSFMGAQPFPILSEDPVQYIRFGNGEIFTVDPINYVLFGEGDAATTRDVLPQLIVGAPISGDFQDPKLSAGDYAFWLNETRAGSTYTLTFEVTPVPEPSTALFGLVGLVGSLFRRVRA